MEPRDIYITKFDLARLKELLEVGISFKERDRDYLESLRNELDRAHIVDPTAVPDDVVTMNSRFRLKRHGDRRGEELFPRVSFGSGYDAEQDLDSCPHRDRCAWISGRRQR